MPQFTYLTGDDTQTVDMPAPTYEVIPGVQWGDPCALFTPAYWYTQFLMRQGNEDCPRSHRVGSTFEEELTVCLLGGYGIPAEVGLAAFDRLKDEGIIRALSADCILLEQLLREPLNVGGRSVRYRFWRQKARYLAAAYAVLQETNLPMQDAVLLRNTLMQIPGIGSKTASWIVRNWLGSNEVAILDIHIVRAGMLARVFSPTDCVTRHYLKMERRFVAFASAVLVPTSDLDALIWATMRTTPRLVMRLLDKQHGQIQGRSNRAGRAPLPSA